MFFDRKVVIETEKEPNKVWVNIIAIVYPLHDLSKKLRMEVEHIILRDQVLKNTQFCVGVVLYAGHDTKTLMN
jgi:hypothetical protein